MATTGIVDLFLLYNFLKRLLMKYENFPAFKTGVIDKDGKVIVPPAKRTPAQKDSFQMYDLVVLKLRHLLDALPGGPNRLKNTIAAIWSIKEGYRFFNAEILNEDDLRESFLGFLSEDGMGAGAVAGPANSSGAMAMTPSTPDKTLATDDPPVSKKKLKTLQQLKGSQMGRRLPPLVGASPPDIAGQ